MNAKGKVGTSIFGDPGGHLGPSTLYLSPPVSKCWLVLLFLGMAWGLSFVVKARAWGSSELSLYPGLTMD